MPIYMKFPGVEGTGKGIHKGWIELDSAQFGVSGHVTNPTGQGTNRDATAPSISEVIVTKTQDIATTGLFQQAFDAKGRKVVIDFVAKDSKNDVPSLSIELEKTVISNYTISGDG